MNAVDLWQRVIKADDGCWLWVGALFAGGYGCVFIGGRVRSTHRVAWELVNGPIPAGLMILHRCDVRRCINPAHLFSGTAADNAHDRDAKGRTARGENAGPAKVSDAQANEIRRRYIYGQGGALAREFGISGAAVSQIVLGQTH